MYFRSRCLINQNLNPESQRSQNRFSRIQANCKKQKKLEEIDEFAEHLDEVIKKTGLLPVKIVTGRYSKRIFDINNCGGEILNLTWHDAKITNQGIEIVKKHLSRFEDIAVNRKMIKRLEQIKSGKLEITDWDKRFFTHETREFNRYKSLGYENSLQKEIPDEIYENAHSATLEDFKLNEIQNDGKRTLYHPEIEDIEFYSDEERKLLGL